MSHIDVDIFRSKHNELQSALTEQRTDRLQVDARSFFYQPQSNKNYKYDLQFFVDCTQYLPQSRISFNKILKYQNFL